eukprot:3236427-Rhodomonas_salina.2
MEVDVSELKRMETEVDLAKMAADKLQNFVSALSHELRTPLNAIIGVADAVQHSPLAASNPHLRTNLGVIKDSGYRLSSLIKDIIATVSTDQIPTSPDPPTTLSSAPPSLQS